MPFLAFFAWLSAFFAETGKKLAFSLAKFSAYSGFILFVLAAYLTATYVLLNDLKVAVPATAVMVWGWVMPANAAACLTTIISARFLRAAYDFKVRLATVKVKTIRS